MSHYLPQYNRPTLAPQCQEWGPIPPRPDPFFCGSATLNKLVSRQLNGDTLEDKVLQKRFHRAEGLPLGLFCYPSWREGRWWETECGSPLEVWIRPSVSVLPLLRCLLLLLPSMWEAHGASDIWWTRVVKAPRTNVRTQCTSFGKMLLLQ